MNEISGTTVARLAWHIPTPVLTALMPHNPNVTIPADILDDVRAQFALYGTTHHTTMFTSIADAWNSFTTPRAGMPRPMVLLPAVPCKTCANTKYRTKNFERRAFTACPECHGTGRKRPRAIPVTEATPATLDAALTHVAA